MLGTLKESHDSVITTQLCLCPAAKTDAAFKAFLEERNPKQQHSSTLESYLIKPIQRVLKYPLLLRELHSLTDPDSEEHYHLDGETSTPYENRPLQTTKSKVDLVFRPKMLLSVV